MSRWVLVGCGLAFLAACQGTDADRAPPEETPSSSAVEPATPPTPADPPPAVEPHLPPAVGQDAPPPSVVTPGDPEAEGAEDPALAFLAAHIAREGVNTTRRGWRSNLELPPRAPFVADRRYFWELKTNKGALKIRLFAESAPMHATNVAFLSLQGFYDGLTFHRVISGFMAQGGCPNGDGTGNPGYRFDGEFSDDQSHDRRGLLSMANSGPGTDGSQFFITFTATPFLDGLHTLFGEVVAGEATLAALEAAGTGTALGTPRESLVIETATLSVEPAR